MGPRKRSKPNPKAEPVSVTEEALLRESPKLQKKDFPDSAAGDSVQPDERKKIDSVPSPINGSNTVSAEDGWLVYNKTDPV